MQNKRFTISAALAVLLPVAALGQILEGEVNVWAGPVYPGGSGFAQTVFLRNNTLVPLNGPIAVAVKGLPATNRVNNRSSLVVNWPGEPYPLVPTSIASGQSLQPGQVAQAVLQLEKTGGGWTLQPLAGIMPKASVAAGDVNGDGISDSVTYRRATGEFMIRLAMTGQQIVIPMGVNGSNYLPVGADYDGDGRMDAAVYDTLNGDWRIRYSSANGTSFTTLAWGWFSDPLGLTENILTPDDFDGDGKADPAIYDALNGLYWYRASVTGQTRSVAMGVSGRPVPADYDGDGIADFAVFASMPNRVIYRSSVSGSQVILGESICGGADDDQFWTGAGDAQITHLIPGYYDADAKADIGIYNRTTGVFRVRGSKTGQVIEMQVAPGATAATGGRFNAGIFGGAIFQTSTALVTRSWPAGETTQGPAANGDLLNTAIRPIR